jgi:hypothetical protein
MNSSHAISLKKNCNFWVFYLWECKTEHQVQKIMTNCACNKQTHFECHMQLCWHADVHYFQSSSSSIYVRMCVCMQFPALGDIPILIKYFLHSTLSSYIDDLFRQCDWNMSHYLHVFACILLLLKPSVMLHCCNILFLWHCVLGLIHAKNEFMNRLCIEV